MNRKILFYAFVLNLVLNCICYCEAIDSIQIIASKTYFKIGEPIIIKVNATFLKPNISSKTNKILESIELNGFSLQIRESDSNDVLVLHGLLPRRLLLEDGQGLQYSSTFIVFYDYNSKRVIFNKSLTYDVKLKSKNKYSNALKLNISSSVSDEKALAILSDPNDFAFLMSGIYKNNVSVSHLDEVVQQCDGTLLSKFCAGRLGIEQSKELQQKYPNGKKIKDKYSQDTTVRLVFDRATLNLEKGLDMPEEIPIRQEVLYYLVSAEIVKGNSEKSMLYAKEVMLKYPHSKYSKEVSNLKQQLSKHNLD